MIKKTIICLYTTLILCMGTATILERFYGATFTATYIYGSWWFVALWALLAACSLVMLLRKRPSPSIMMLHLSFVGILAGAFVTYLTAKRGTIHLRMDEESRQYINQETKTAEALPITLTLTDFVIVNYPGTDAPMDYVSTVKVSSMGNMADSATLTISMNRIGSTNGYRLYQSSYDEDEQGTHLLVTHDPYGIALTYASYALLLVSLIAVCIKRIKRRTLALTIMCALPVSGTLAGTPTLSPDIAHDLGTVAVLYNNRICPLNTAATDFVQKLAGKPTWQGLSADEIFLGWMIYYDDWEQQPIIKVKSQEVQKMLGIHDSWASLRHFYTARNEYKLQTYLNDGTLPASTRKAVLEADEKVRIISMFYAGEFLRMFPLNSNWYAPGSTELPKDTPEKEFLFIKRVMDQVTQATLTGDEVKASTLIAKIRNYQQAHAPIPSTLQVEVFYNKMLAQRTPIMVFVALSLVLCVASFVRSSQGRAMHILQLALQALLLLYTTMLLALRWMVSGHVPLSNGFETMQFMAWATILITLLMQRRVPPLRPIGVVVSSFALLVSTIACGSPQLTPLMPVLQSPLMSLHVMMVMLAYSLFAIQTFLSLQALCTKKASSSPVLLFPAVCFLTIGIFLGAVWANISWGRYWGWDPKETWALITLMVYAVPLHKSFFPHSASEASRQQVAEATNHRVSVASRQQTVGRAFHIYMLLAFLTVAMTYFGVNYLLGGMHSYA